MTYQRYTSNELTHFVGRTCASDDERYDLLVKILHDSKLRASGVSGAGEDATAVLSVTGNGKISDESAIQGQIVCFCDIPMAGLGLHMGKYSQFGLAFLKPFLVARGANPVFYVVRDAVVPGVSMVPTGSGAIERKRGITRAELMDQIHAEAIAVSIEVHDLMFGSDNPELQKLLFRAEYLRQMIYQAVLAFIKPFDSTEPDDSKHNFYMEREWRVYGDVLFQTSDVSRIILPPSYIDSFLKEFPDLSTLVGTAA